MFYTNIRGVRKYSTISIVVSVAALPPPPTIRVHYNILYATLSPVTFFDDLVV